MVAGYSGKSLATKLGVKPGMCTLLIAPPAHFAALLGDIYQALDLRTVENLEGAQHDRQQYDYIHWFVREQVELTHAFMQYKALLDVKGMFWISWHKKAAKVTTDVTEALVRQTALDHGLVDVKVCAVDATWSGLKHVYRLSDR